MELLTLKPAEFNEFLRDWHEFKKQFIGFKSEPLKPVYNTKELSILFNVSTRTLQSWRDEGAIGFTQKNSVILYSIEDIQEFLKKYHKNPFKK